MTDVFSAERLSSEVINASRIRVAGVGGLGLVAMALTVAIGVPGVGIPLALGGALGTVLSIEAAGAPEIGDTDSRSVDQGVRHGQFRVRRTRVSRLPLRLSCCSQ